MYILVEVINMEEEVFYIEDGAEVARPAWMQVENNSKYGGVAGLSDEELASPQELERIYYRELWGPILLISKPKQAFNPAWDCHSDTNVFATADFDRMMPEFDKLRYVRDKLRGQVKDLVILMRIVSERIRDIRKYKILRLVGKELLDADDIQHWDLWQLALMYKRALRIRENIDRLVAKSRQQKQEDYGKWLEGLG